MTTVALFHSVLGVRPGVHDAAARLRGAGHEVHVADLFDGRTFDEYASAMAYAWEELGQVELLRRASAAVEAIPDGFLVAGFSLGCVAAVHVALTRPVSGALMIAGAMPASAFGADAAWPRGVDAQTHATVGDPWREQSEIDQTVRDIEVAGGSITVFDYPGSGHLFSDPSLPSEYDAAVTETFWANALPFVAACG